MWKVSGNTILDVHECLLLERHFRFRRHSLNGVGTVNGCGIDDRSEPSAVAKIYWEHQGGQISNRNRKTSKLLIRCRVPVGRSSLRWWRLWEFSVTNCGIVKGGLWTHFPWHESQSKSCWRCTKDRYHDMTAKMPLSSP